MFLALCLLVPVVHGKLLLHLSQLQLHSCRADFSARAATLWLLQARFSRRLYTHDNPSSMIVLQLRYCLNQKQHLNMVGREWWKIQENVFFKKTKKLYRVQEHIKSHKQVFDFINRFENGVRDQIIFRFFPVSISNEWSLSFVSHIGWPCLLRCYTVGVTGADLVRGMILKWKIWGQLHCFGHHHGDRLPYNIIISLWKLWEKVIS